MADDAAAAAADAGGGDGTQCTNHPFRNTSSPGGICALCLQDKLGKLVSSSSSSFIPTSSTSPSPSPSLSTSSTLTLRPQPQPHHHQRHAPVSDVNMRHSRRGSHFPFLLSQHHPKNTSSTSSSVSYEEGLTPRRRGFWSFLHISSSHQKHDRPNVGPGPTPTTSNATEVSPVEDERKVSRSRSIGCGSRSFSGFADCALRRVESTREGRRSTSSARDIVKHRARCGGLFGGFVIASSSSSSSSSSYWTAIADEPNNVNAKPNGAATATPRVGPLVHGRTKSWGRALASPMRVFTKPIITSTTTIIRSSTGSGVGGEKANGNGTTKAPNMSNIPSLLSVR